MRENVGFSRIIGLSSAIIIGVLITVGIGTFLIPIGLPFNIKEIPPAGYFLGVLVFLPVILTWVERAAVMPGSGGSFNLSRSKNSLISIFFTGWLILGGYAALGALLTWGTSVYLNLILDRIFGLAIETHWLSVGVIIAVGLYELLGTRENLFARNLIIGSTLAILIVLLVLGFFFPPGSAGGVLRSISEQKNILRFLPWLAIFLWGPEFILAQRDKIRDPGKTLFPALLASIIIGSLVSLAAVSLIQSKPPNDLEIPVSIAALALDQNPVFGLVFLFASLSILLTGLIKALLNGMRLASIMVRDGFLPGWLNTILADTGIPIYSSTLAIGVMIVLIFFVPIDMIAGFASLVLLLALAIIFIPAIFQKDILPEDRQFKLPLYPLFPVLTSVLSISIALLLPREPWIISLEWGLIGLVIYAGFAREGAIDVRRRAVVFGRPSEDSDAYRVLVGIANPQTAPFILKAGAQLAAPRGGELLVLQVIILPQQMPAYLMRNTAKAASEYLNNLVTQVDLGGVKVRSLVRLAPSPVDGILQTSREEQVDLILLGWPGDKPDIPFIVHSVVRQAPSQVAVLHGNLPEEINDIIVPVGNYHASTALKIGCSLLPPDGKAVALDIVRGQLSDEKEETALKRITQAVENVDDPEKVAERVIQSANFKRAVIREAEGYDLLLMGITTDDFLESKTFGGTPVEIAQSRTRPTMLVKRREEAHRFWWRRLWEEIANIMPKLSLSEQSTVYRSMQQDSAADIDFYILILLASAIAYFGLLQNSGAVIIGGMLVAPLMSPMMAMAHSIAQGNLMMFRRATGSTMRGLLTAIGASMLFTILLPNLGTATHEILSRTEPNMLDMLVALVSGAAAAYALSRKEVAAALPGVAIAAALVPPLCVVGYGLGSGQFEIAGGSMLLFTTNLASIIFAGAITFITLGFRPPRAERIDQVRRSLIFAIAGLFVIAIPLSITTVQSFQHSKRISTVESIILDEIPPGIADIENIQVQRYEDGFSVSFTAYIYSKVKAIHSDTIQERIETALEDEVYIHARLIEATMRETGP